MKRICSALLIVVGLCLMAVGFFSTTVGANPPDDLHCPDKDNPAKVENAESAGGLVLPAGTVFCAKKKTGATLENGEPIVADGVKSIYDYLVQYGIDGAVGQGPSYYIVYSEPTDVCENIDGVQATVPGGMVKNDDGDCVTPPTDVCPNLDGVQETVPDGYDLVDGTCIEEIVPCDTTDPEAECYVPPVVDVCPNIDGDQTVVPDGMVLTDGKCEVPVVVIPVIDVCPNIDGNQAEIPDGMERDADGDCVVPEPPVTTPPVTTPPVTTPPVTTPPATTPPKIGTPSVIVRPPVQVTAPPTTAAPEVVTYELAETGSSDSLPVLTLTGIGLLVLGVAMSRKSQRI